MAASLASHFAKKRSADGANERAQQQQRAAGENAAAVSAGGREAQSANGSESMTPFRFAFRLPNAGGESSGDKKKKAKKKKKKKAGKGSGASDAVDVADEIDHVVTQSVIAPSSPPNASKSSLDPDAIEETLVTHAGSAVKPTGATKKSKKKKKKKAAPTEAPVVTSPPSNSSSKAVKAKTPATQRPAAPGASGSSASFLKLRKATGSESEIAKMQLKYGRGRRNLKAIAQREERKKKDAPASDSSHQTAADAQVAPRTSDAVATTFRFNFGAL
jgi:hypothetical protein|uniref:Uncharacterized protein n=1 Tax=Globisporangium ultimum (strain ATCC 200006 / CBS 805.95 / DAOM BR144) TaxID=431595 RepID=K3WG04_GLOUD